MTFYYFPSSYSSGPYSYMLFRNISFTAVRSTVTSITLQYLNLASSLSCYFSLVCRPVLNIRVLNDQPPLDYGGRPCLQITTFFFFTIA